MSEVGDNERRISDLDAHDVVDNPCLRDVTHVYEIVTDFLLHDGFHNILNKCIQGRIVELHGNESIIYFEFSVFFLFVLFPSFKGKVDAQKYRIFKGSDMIFGLDNADIYQLMYELRGEIIVTIIRINRFT